MSSKPSLVVPLSLVPLLLITAGNAQEEDNHRLYVPVPNSPAGGLTPVFSEAVMTGGTNYIVGHFGRDAATHRAPCDSDVGPYPARALVGVKNLLFGAHLEIADVAMVSSNAS